MNAVRSYARFLGFAVSLPASAELIARDWLAPGDGLLTYDPIHQREWLDIPVSELSQFGSTIDEAVVVAELELLPGGRFEGFHFADREDVEQLVSASGFDQSSFEKRVETADQMRNLIRHLDGLGAVPEPSGTGGTVGVIDEFLFEGQPFYPTRVAAFMSLSGRTPTRPDGLGTLAFGNQGDFFTRSCVRHGMMLYRNAAPEPATATLLTLGVMGGVLRRSRQ